MMNDTKEFNRGYLFFIGIIAALGGFLFGYDTAVISGTIGMVSSKYQLDTIMEGWFVSSALVGCIIGVSFAGELSDRFGRKKSLIVSGILFSVSAIGCALCGSHTELIIYRLIGGVGVGVASMVSPLYLSEISPANIRGRMVVLYQFAITVGILCAYFANAFMLGLSESISSSEGSLIDLILVEEVWRGMFGSEAIPAVLFFLAMLLVPESPRWFAAKNKKDAALDVLSRINGQQSAEIELQSISSALEKEEKGSWLVLTHKGIRTVVWIGIILAVLSQFTGINAIIYYGPKIMEEAGLKLSDALGGQVIIGFVNVTATLFAIWKIDTFGRKKLMRGGVASMFVSLVAVGVLFLAGYTQSIFLLIFIITFIASYAIGYGPVIWTLLSEIYPTKIRGRAMSVATLSLWVGATIIGQIVPWMLDTLTPAGTFFVFALCCIPVPFILKKLPETKGKSLEEIESFWLQN